MFNYFNYLTSYLDICSNILKCLSILFCPLYILFGERYRNSFPISIYPPSYQLKSYLAVSGGTGI